MKFHEKLYQIRKNAGMTQDRLAEKLHVSRQAVSRWEMGTAMPDVENLVAISDLFAVSLDELLKDGPVLAKQTEEPDPFKKENPDQKTEPKGSWLLIPIALPLIALSLFLYGWLFEKDILFDIGFLLLGLSLAVVLLGILIASVLPVIKRWKEKRRDT